MVLSTGSCTESRDGVRIFRTFLSKRVCLFVPRVAFVGRDPSQKDVVVLSKFVQLGDGFAGCFRFNLSARVYLARTI